MSDMTKREMVEATAALSAWFDSQKDIAPKYRAIVAMYWIASEVAIQGETPERLDMGLMIMKGLLDSKAKEMRELLDQLGA